MFKIFRKYTKQIKKKNTTNLSFFFFFLSKGSKGINERVNKLINRAEHLWVRRIHKSDGYGLR